MDDQLTTQIETAARWIADSEHLVVFTGAGISTDSGMPDYRGPDGVWTRRDKGLPPPKWTKAPSEICPNRAHYALAELQNLNRLGYLISQNVDNLHLESGVDPDRLAELHGNKELMRCLGCASVFTRAELRWTRERWGNAYLTDDAVPGQPACAGCKGRLVSTIVNFGDSMPALELNLAYEHSQLCDLFFAIGSSLMVSPANEMPRVAVCEGARLILLNIGETPCDDIAHLRISAGIGDVLPAIAERVKELLGYRVN